MMKVLCTRAGKCESGATAMEYALTAAILSIALLTGADTLGNAVTNSFTSMSQRMALAAPERAQTVGGKGLVALEPGPSTRGFGSVHKASFTPQP
ncbi:Flp family type IVb pilin [uncultured Hoeflea sp.]|uniref:Flp family type IVb pilin n=1 Tax=uncultured Hoeflea sp. TaxID=538666 RepID=UPI0030EF8241|tara:strand:+ start:16090 stop:16374 length:285 start_codon:yes stop_codon:yes gene_type:complete